MSAPVFQSVQSSDTAITGSGTRTVTKPVSLAVGDLMIGFATNNTGTGTGFPSGFTSLGSEDNTAGIRVSLAYKVADSADVAATDFAFTTCGFASIARVTGHGGAGAIVYIDGQQTNSASFSAGGLTPRNYGDSTLLMMYLAFTNGSSGTVGSYAIATSDPGLIERDNYPGADVTGTGMATATRPEVTATGNFSGSGAGGLGADWAGIMISIAVPYTITVAESTTLTEASLENISATYSNTVTLTEDIDADIGHWSNPNKNSSTWTNPDKNSTISATNPDKSSISWTNPNKSL